MVFWFGSLALHLLPQGQVLGQGPIPGAKDGSFGFFLKIPFSGTGHFGCFEAELGESFLG
jgi:hypothetical protein